MKKHRSKSFQSHKLKTIISSVIVLVFLAYVLFVVYSALRNAADDINFAGLEVAVNTDTTVFLDGKKIGTASPDSSLIFSKVTPGKKLISLLKNGSDNIQYEREIVFEKGTKTSIDWHFGVTANTSSGLIKYFIKKSAEMNKIRVLTQNDGSKMTVDGVESLDGTIPADGSDHNVEITKDGYLPKDLTLSLYNKYSKDNRITQSEKEKYDNYDLVVEVSLFEIPFS